MPHVALVPLTGLRVRQQQLLELGMTLPGLGRRGQALAELPALGLLTLAGMTPPSWSLSYHEAGGALAERVDLVLDRHPDLVAVSALTASIEEAYGFCDALRARRIPVVIGGLHVSVCPDEAREHADAVVVGEGESVWPQVLADAASGRLKREYRSSASFDLAQAPLPRYDLLGSKTRPRFTLQTERGCPFACDFCAASRLLGPFREKPLDNIARELQEIRRLDARPWLELADDNTFAGSRDARRLLELLGNSAARYFTEVDWRIGQRADILSDLAASGCVQVLVGIESLVFRYPGMGAKDADLERIMEAVCAIQQAGVAVNGCFIVGAEGENRQSLQRLTEFILNSPLAEVQLTLQTPFPGTKLYQDLKRQGRLLADRGWSHYTLFDVTYQPDSMPVAELERGFRQVIAHVFSPQAVAGRSQIRREIWRQRDQAPNR